MQSNPFAELFLYNQCFKASFSSIEKIGEGGFGNVYKARSLQDNRLYAIKEIKIKLNHKKFQRSKAKFESALNEILFLSLNQSPYVVKLYHAWMEFDKDKSSSNCLPKPKQFSSSQLLSKESVFNAVLSISKRIRIYIQMELCDSNLNDFIATSASHQATNQEMLNRLNVSLQIAKAICDVHRLGIIHRDIKGNNVFINKDKIQLGDFGLATFINDKKYKIYNGHNKSLNYHSKEVGTLMYMSPEQTTNYYNEKSDIYSFGLLLYEIMCPYTCQMEKIEMFSKLKSKGEIDNKVLNKRFPQIKDLIVSMVNNDMNKRPDMNEVIDILEEEIDRMESIVNRKMSLSVDEEKDESTVIESEVMSEGCECNDFLFLFEKENSQYGNRLCLSLSEDDDDDMISCCSV